MYEYPKDNRIKSPKEKVKGEKEKTPRCDLAEIFMIKV